MSNYRRLISYIYAYEGGVKGKNIGFAKIEIRNGQCRIHVNVKRIFLGNSDIGVYLLSPQMEILLGRIFIRNGAGEFRVTVNAANVESSGCSMEQCYGLTIHEMENAWRSYTTIWEDAVTQAAEVDLANVTAERAGVWPGEQAGSSVAQEIQRELEQRSPREGQAEPQGEPEPVNVPGSKEREDKAAEGRADIPTEENVQEETPVPLQEIYENVGNIGQEIQENHSKMEDEQKKQGEKSERVENTGEADRADSITGAEKESRGGDTGGEEKGPRGDGMGGEEKEPRGENMGGEEKGSRGDGMGRTEKSPHGEDVGGEERGPHGEDVGGEERGPRGEDTGGVERGPCAENMTGTEGGWIRGTPVETAWKGGVSSQENLAGSPGGGVQEKMVRLAKVLLQGRVPAEKGPEPLPRPRTQSAANIPSSATGTAVPSQPVMVTNVPVSTLPEPEDPARLAELDRQERAESARGSIWNQLQRRYAKVLAFDYENGCEILSIKPQDIGILPRENWIYGNNSFLLHGYYNYRHLILARLENPNGQPRYLLGVPGHYFSNEKNLASMFGFPHFVLAKKQPEQDGRFGYWYTDLRL